jgi:uncharacterized surface protein with fasciclin (FAS1) repeats
MKNLLRNFTLVVISFLAFSCGKEENNNLPSTSIAKIIEVTPELSNLKEALDITGLTATFEAQGNYTVFAPTNTAFSNLLTDLGVSDIESIDLNVLTDVLKYHVINGEVLSSSFVNGATIATLQGQNISVLLSPNPYFPEADPDLSINESINNIFREETSVFINTTARVYSRDVKCSNGVIHVVREVLRIPSN